MKPCKRHDQYEVSDLLADLATGKHPRIHEYKFLMDLSDKIGNMDVRTKRNLTSLSEKLRRADLKPHFTKEERRALYIIRSFLHWINPSEEDPYDER